MKVIFRYIFIRAHGRAAVVAQMEDMRLDTQPAQVTRHSDGDVCFPSGGQANRYDHNAA